MCVRLCVWVCCLMCLSRCLLLFEFCVFGVIVRYVILLIFFCWYGYSVV